MQKSIVHKFVFAFLLVSEIGFSQQVQNFDFLKEDLKDIDIVLLGEPDHLSKYYASKIDLVKYLHENLGYTVLAFESGFYEMHLVNKELLDERNNVSAVFEKGLFSIWSDDNEMNPIFDYIAEQRKKGTPIVIAGFDCQPSGQVEITELIAGIKNALVGHISANSQNAFNLLQKQLDSYKQDSQLTDDFSQKDLSQIKALQESISTQPSLEFYNQTLKSWIGFLSYQLSQKFSQRKFKASDSNSRDSLMASNMLYLFTNQYKGQKVIGWGATGHFANKLDQLKMKDSDHIDFRAMGWHLKKELGKKIFTLAVTSDDDEPQSLEQELTKKGTQMSWISPSALKEKIIKTICLGEWAEGNMADAVDGILFTKEKEIAATLSVNQKFMGGKIIDSKTKLPVTFASVWVEGTTVGTASNGDGRFQILKTPITEGKDLRISCVGYMTKTVSQRKNFDYLNGVIRLTAENAFLNEVTITSHRIDPKQYIRDAIASIEDNYFQQPFNLDFYSKLVSIDSIGTREFQLESIIQGYYEGYSHHRKKNFKLTQKRTRGRNFLNEINYNPWPPWELISIDLITNEYKIGILNISHLDKFNVKLRGIDKFEGDTLLILDYFLPKISNKVTGYSSVERYYGSLYIGLNDNAIVKHQMNIDADVDFDLEILYRKSGSKYFPYYLKSLRINSYKISGVNREIKTSNEIVLIRTDTENVAPFENDMKLWNPNSIQSSEDFWNTFYPRNDK